MAYKFDSQVHEGYPLDIDPNDKIDFTETDWKLGKDLPKFGRLCPVCYGHGYFEVWVNGSFDADGCYYCNAQGYVINKKLSEN